MRHDSIFSLSTPDISRLRKSRFCRDNGNPTGPGLKHRPQAVVFVCGNREGRQDEFYQFLLDLVPPAVDERQVMSRCIHGPDVSRLARKMLLSIIQGMYILHEMLRRPRSVLSILLGLPQFFQDGHGLLLGRISQVEKKPDGPGKTPARFIPGTAGLRDGNPAPEFGLVDAQLRSEQFGFLAGFNEVSWLAHRGYRFAARCVIGKLFASWLYAEIYMTQPSAEYPSLISTRQRRSTSSARAEFSNDNKCSAMVNG